MKLMLLKAPQKQRNNMQNSRSIESQRARLLGKKYTSKQQSDKFVKKEIINMKYGLKTVPHKSNTKNLYFATGVFGVTLLLTFTIFHPILALIMSLVSYFVTIGISSLFNTKKIVNSLPPKYTINFIFEKYDSILVGDIKEKMVSIKDHINKLLECELNLQSKHYIESTVSKDLPEIFNNFLHVKNGHHKLLEQLSIIEEKLIDINKTIEINYEHKNEIKLRVIKEKANI